MRNIANYNLRINSKKNEKEEGLGVVMGLEGSEKRVE